MSKVLIETQYFPSIAFFAYEYKYEQVILDQHEHYQKGSFRNRTNLLSSQGKLSLSVPLKSGKNNQTPIAEVLIDNSDNWRINHLRAIQSCYGKSPYFEYYFHHMEEVLTKEWTLLFDLNLCTIKKCRELLANDSTLILSDSYLSKENQNVDIRRDFISPKKNRNVRIQQEFNFKSYEQVYSDTLPFEPNLSILDLLFCLGPEARLYLRYIVI